jgi:hypothetical protein
MAGKFILKMPEFHLAFRDVLHAVNLRHGTHSFIVLEDFFRHEKSDGFGRFEPANFGSKGQHATSRPP